MADSQRRPLAGSDHQIVVARKNDAQCVSTAKPRQGLMGGFNGFQALFEIVCDQMKNRLCVGLSLEHIALFGEFLA